MEAQKVIKLSGAILLVMALSIFVYKAGYKRGVKENSKFWSAELQKQGKEIDTLADRVYAYKKTHDSIKKLKIKCK